MTSAPSIPPAAPPRVTPEPPGNTPGLRYEALVKIASGGMATVFVGALRGPFGFEQLVAIKRPHEHLLEDPSFRDALIAEARLASRLRHANVVDVRDIDAVGESIQIVMDYVEGASLFQLIQSERKGGPRLPAAIAVRIILDACAGLHAAHELLNEEGERVGIIHRDISPQNILVGVDGLGRVTDFGVAKEEQASRPSTMQGTLKGKLGYMAPEYILGKRPDRRVDVFGMGVVLWEALAQKRLFRGTNQADAIERVLYEEAPRLGEAAPDLGDVFDEVAAKALAKDPENRFQTAEEIAIALEDAARRAGLVAGHAEVGRFVREAVGEDLAKRRDLVREKRASLREPQSAEGPILKEAQAKDPASAAGGTVSSVTITTDEAPTKIYAGRAASARVDEARRPRAILVAVAVAVAGVAVGTAIALTPRSQPPEPAPSARRAAIAEPAGSAEPAARGRGAELNPPVESPTSDPKPSAEPSASSLNPAAPAPAPRPTPQTPKTAASALPPAPAKKPAPPATTSQNRKSLPPNPYAR